MVWHHWMRFWGLIWKNKRMNAPVIATTTMMMITAMITPIIMIIIIMIMIMMLFYLSLSPCQK